MYLNLFERYWSWIGKYHDKIEVARDKAAKKKAEEERKAEFLKSFKAKYPNAYEMYLSSKDANGKNKECNERLDLIYIEAIDSGLVEAKRGDHYCIAKFNNGTKIQFWISNKWYAYAQNTTVLLKGEKTEYFGHDMPNFVTKFLIHEQIEKKAKYNSEVYSNGRLEDF